MYYSLLLLTGQLIRPQKTAIDQWFRTVAAELKPVDIRIASVYLPLVRTRMIEPMKAYRNMPAMTAKQAAIVIARCILKRKKIFKPWWCTIPQWISFIFNREWQYIAGRFIKKRK